MIDKVAVIIGAGPAGLTAAYEFLEHTDITPIVLEATNEIGGISKTVNYKGNRIDIGGHRFFSKSDWVMRWWRNIMPLQGAPSRDDLLLKRDVPLSKEPGAPDPGKTDRVMLVRNRISRIFFLRRFFDYPISLNLATISNLGLVRVAKIGISYIWTKAFPRRHESVLEDFFVNRFGRELYETFFKDYTEKVWGVSCREIPADWGAQRIKGLNVTKAVLHALKKLFKRDQSLGQESTETSLIEQFTYPKFGPGQMWEEVAGLIEKKGGKVNLKCEVVGVVCKDGNVVEVKVRNGVSGELETCKGNYFLSTMPVKDLVSALETSNPGLVPDDVGSVARGLTYRDFITAGILLKQLKIGNESKIPTVGDIVPDNWIYIQERDVKIGRLQIFNNWSPYLVKEAGTVWLGLEYFCNEGDALWRMSDKAFIEFAVEELAKIDIIEKDKVLDGVVIRVPKAYPAYFGAYDRFPVVRQFLDKIGNLYLIGRNGMHRYNNQDHSMLAAMTAVSNIAVGKADKDNIWSVNAEAEYHERK